MAGPNIYDHMPIPTAGTPLIIDASGVPDPSWYMFWQFLWKKLGWSIQGIGETLLLRLIDGVPTIYLASAPDTAVGQISTSTIALEQINQALQTTNVTLKLGNPLVYNGPTIEGYSSGHATWDSRLAFLAGTGIEGQGLIQITAAEVDLNTPLLRVNGMLDLAIYANSGNGVGQSSRLVLQDNGVDKWWIDKPADNSFGIFNSSTGNFPMTIAPTSDVVSFQETITVNLVEAVDDATALAAGVPINGLYRNGNAVQVRLT